MEFIIIISGSPIRFEWKKIFKTNAIQINVY